MQGVIIFMFRGRANHPDVGLKVKQCFPDINLKEYFGEPFEDLFKHHYFVNNFNDLFLQRCKQ